VRAVSIYDVFFRSLFFRANQINSSGGGPLDDEEDEEELVWEQEDEGAESGGDSTRSIAPSGTGLAGTTISSDNMSLRASSNDSADAFRGFGSEKSTWSTRAGSSQTTAQLRTEAGTNTKVSSTASTAAQTAPSGGSAPGIAGQANIQELISVNEHMHERVHVLEEENQRLLQHEEELNRRVRELEATLAALEHAKHNSPPEPPTPSSQLASGAANSTPQSKRASASNTALTSTPPSHAYHNTATPPAATADTISAPATATGPTSKKKSASTAKKLFDSPAPAAASETPDRQAAEPIVSVPVVAAVSTATAHIPLPEFASQSSEDSAVVVSRSDVNSLGDDDLAVTHTTTAAPSAGAVSAISHVGDDHGSSAMKASAAAPHSAGKSSISQETAKYLAALDDQEDEEDGWN
jgi:hypothetical protein